MLLVLGEHTLGRRAGGSGESWGLSQKSRGLLQPPVQKWAPSLKMVAPRGLSVCTARVEDLFCTYWRMFKLTPCHPNSRGSMGLPQSLLVWKVVPPQARVSHGAPASSAVKPTLPTQATCLGAKLPVPSASHQTSQDGVALLALRTLPTHGPSPVLRGQKQTQQANN
jgi:hypothetical protein